MKHYIRLLTERELSDDEMDLWFNTVVKFAPPGVAVYDESDEFEVEEDEVEGDEGLDNVYIVYLTRDLQPSEAEFIVTAWEFRYADDFEIEISNLYRADANLQNPFELEIEPEAYENIKQTAAKFVHNRWVDQKIQEGWRYGLRMSTARKTHPALRDWDSLPHAYRKIPVMSERQALDFYTKYRHLF
jgi:hypothetical protein